MSERAEIVHAMQMLCDEYRGYAMPEAAQYAFDDLARRLDAHDARAAERATAPPDPRDAILHGMRARVQGVPGW
ncbi:hypothetical protein [Methylobacterium sp. D54C]